MSTINESQFKKIKLSYSNGNSAREIADELNVSIDAVYYFFRKHGIPRRLAAENNKLQFLKKKKSFIIKERLTNNEELLKLAGIMLYWGEGSQWSGETIVDFANSNPQMVKIFLNFLRSICGINERKLRAYVYCYINQNPREIMSFWEMTTGIPSNQFTKPYIRKDYRLSKSGKMRYGVIHIRYGDKKLLFQLKQWIQESVDFFNKGRWRSGQTHQTVNLTPYGFVGSNPTLPK